MPHIPFSEPRPILVVGGSKHNRLSNLDEPSALMGRSEAQIRLPLNDEVLRADLKADSLVVTHDAAKN
jgi:hypothetical protein